MPSHPTASLGIDIGGSGIKGAPVDLEVGALVSDRLRIDTPNPSTPEAVADVIAQIVDHFKDVVGPTAPIGVTIPGVVMHGVVKTAANIDKGWIDCPMEDMLEARLGRDIVVVNDADAAGVGELHYGAAKGQQGLVILTTLGTGIGSAMLVDGALVPNTELGHLELDGHDRVRPFGVVDVGGRRALVEAHEQVHSAPAADRCGRHVPPERGEHLRGLVQASTQSAARREARARRRRRPGRWRRTRC